MGFFHTLPIGANTIRLSTNWSDAGGARRKVRRQSAVVDGPQTERTIRSLVDLHAAVKHYVESIPYGQILSAATHISTDIDYRLVSEGEMESALGRRAQAGPAERDCYASYVNEVFLSALEKHGEEIVFQFSLGAEPLPLRLAAGFPNRLSPRSPP